MKKEVIGIGKVDRRIGIGSDVIDNIGIGAYRCLSMPADAWKNP